MKSPTAGIVDRHVQLRRPRPPEQPPRRVGHPDVREVRLRHQPPPLHRLPRGRHLAQPLEHPMPHRPVRGQVGILHLDRQHRPHPAHILRRPRDRQLPVLQRPQPRQQIGQRRGIEPGPHLPAIDQLPVHPLPERQRAQSSRRRRRRVAHDHEVPVELRLALHPGLRPPRVIDRRRPLRDHPLQPHPRHLLVEPRPAPLHMVGELDRRPPRRPRQQLPQQPLPLHQRHRRPGSTRPAAPGRRRRTPARSAPPATARPASSANRLTPPSSRTTISPSTTASRHGSARNASARSP